MNIEINSKQYQIDEDGFLVQIDHWDEEWTCFAAGEEGIAMTDDHDRVITALHKCYFSRNGVLPKKTMTVVCREAGIKIKRMYELFPMDPVKRASKIGGIPRQCLS